MNENNIQQNEYITREPIFYKKYFEGTKQLKNHFKDKELQIISNVRKFRTSKENGGYDEIFVNEEQKLFGGISNQISFIFPPNLRTFQNRIWFRYYKENPLNKNINDIPYYTLVNVGNRKFIILEKESDVTDNEGKPFKINNLNYLDIITTIIKNKLREDKDNLTYANSTAEILGFIYAARALNGENINNFEVLDPYFPNPFIKETLKEKCDFDVKKIYLEVVLYNEHVSILMFYFKEIRPNFYLRKNTLFDMSSAHFKLVQNNDPIFNEEMKYGLEKFPKNSIQLGGSSSLWFFSTMLILLKNKITLPLKNEFLMQIILKAYELLDIKEIDIANEKIQKREVQNIERNSFLSYKIALRTFINADEFIKQFYFSTYLFPNYRLEKYQKKILDLRKSINLVELNYKYYLITFKKEILAKIDFQNLRNNLNLVEKVFFDVIQAIKEYHKYSGEENNISSIVLLNKDIAIEKADQKFENTIDNFGSNVKWKDCTIYNKEKLFQMYFDNSDIFLKVIDN